MRDAAARERLETALAELEKSLESPVVPGELPRWVESVRKNLEEAGRLVSQNISRMHPDQFKEITEQDPELLPRIQRLKQEDQELVEQYESFHHKVSGLAEHSPDIEPDEVKVEKGIEALAKEGIEWVIRARKQEAAIDTWFLEAFQRDRGDVD